MDCLRVTMTIISAAPRPPNQHWSNYNNNNNSAATRSLATIKTGWMASLKMTLDIGDQDEIFAMEQRLISI